MRNVLAVLAAYLLMPTLALAQGGSGQIDTSPVPSCGANPATCNVIGRVQEVDALALSAGSVTSAAVIPIGGATFIDTAGYSSISVQFTSAGTSNTLVVEVSDDNSNWATQPLINGASLFSAGSSNLSYGNNNTLVSGLVLQGRVVSRYIRFRVASYGSGTVTALGTLRKSAFVAPPYAAQGAIPVGTAFQATSLPVPIAVHPRTSNSNVSANQVQDWTATLAGVGIVKPYSIPEGDWQFVGTLANGSLTATVKAAGATGVKNYVTGCTVSSDTLGAASMVSLKDGSGGTAIWSARLQTTATAPQTHTFPTPLQGTAETLLQLATTDPTTGTIYVSCQGFQAP